MSRARAKGIKIVVESSAASGLWGCEKAGLVLEEVEIVPDEDDDYTARKNRGLSRAARKLFRRGK
jgi:hypothetical protein